MTPSLRWSAGFSLLLLGLAYSSADDAAKPAAKKAGAKKTPVISKAQEAEALKFAGEHHPELAELLEQLNKSNRPEYDRAIRDLSQASTRLQRIQRQAPSRYPAALESWKLDSRIRLLAARSSMTDDPELEAKLQDAVRTRVEVRVQDLSFERDRLFERAKKLDEQIQAIKANPEKAAEDDLRRVKASIKKDAQKRPKKKAGQSAKKTKPKKPRKSSGDAKPSKPSPEATTQKK